MAGDDATSAECTIGPLYGRQARSLQHAPGVGSWKGLNMNAYLVGGAVRDRLLGLSVTDRDWVVVGRTPADMIDAGFRPVGKDFPVFLHPETHDEYALARTERKSGPGYRGFVVNADASVTLEEDLSRRDLTINAIAMHEDGSFIDPYNGRGDIEARVLRHVSPAFIEDPVRVLRVARFMARLAPCGFSVAEETRSLMQDMVATGELEHLVAERVWQELEGALAAPAPRQFIDTLRSCGALGVVLPEVDRLFGVPQPAEHHPEIDSGEHSLLVLEQAVLRDTSVDTRLAALLHDLGKGTTPVEQWPRHPGHEGRGAEIVIDLAERLRFPKQARDLATLSARYHGQAHDVESLRATTIARLLEALDVVRKPERFERFLIVCEADSRGRLGFEDRPYPRLLSCACWRSLGGRWTPVLSPRRRVRRRVYRRRFVIHGSRR